MYLLKTPNLQFRKVMCTQTLWLSSTIRIWLLPETLLFRWNVILALRATSPYPQILRRETGKKQTYRIQYFFYLHNLQIATNKTRILNSQQFNQISLTQSQNLTTTTTKSTPIPPYPSYRSDQQQVLRSRWSVRIRLHKRTLESTIRCTITRKRLHSHLTRYSLHQYEEQWNQ